jgi:hypothetical protein
VKHNSRVRPLSKNAPTHRIVWALALSVFLICSAKCIGAKTQKIMLFGGDKHKVYLGCLNCSTSASDSVHNKFGPHGSRFASESIWNHFSDYGSKFSDYGVCNRFATDPPVIVDQDGAYYGRLTLNRYHAEIGAGKELIDWLNSEVCENG